MKKLKQLSFFGLALTFILSSCSMEKRHYMSGYYMSLHNNDNVVKNTVKNLETPENKSKDKKVVSAAQAEMLVADNSKVNENPITASTDNSIFIPATHKINFSKKSNPVVSINSNAIYKPATIAKEKAHKSLKQKRRGDTPVVILYILCFLIPFVAVGIATNWDLGPVLLNILLCFLFFLPGIIHALIVVSNHS